MIRYLALALLLAGPAYAQQQCGPFEQWAEQLHTQFGEAPAFLGLDDRGPMTFLFINGETGTWTVLVLFPGGEACAAASGKDGEMVPLGEPT